MWKNIRFVLALCCIIGFIVLFVDQSENNKFAQNFVWLVQLQLVPAILKGSIFIVIALIILTIIFGRIYCSVICPFGLLQDILISFRGNKKFNYSVAHNVLRYIFLIIFILSFFIGLPFIFNLLEPYSAFGRIATDLINPIIALVNNGVEFITRSFDSPLVVLKPVFIKGNAALFASILTLIVIFYLVIKNGRTWCNIICPVGTFLGFISRFSFIHPRIDNQKCSNCRKCESVCKAACIDIERSNIDLSRCVACFNCKDVCKFGALDFSWKSIGDKNFKIDRRKMFLGGIISLFAHSSLARAASDHADEENIAATKYKEKRSYKYPLLPPGAQNANHFSVRCTGCQLCVSNCPNDVLRSRDNGNGMFQPSMHFEYGFCRTNCVNCSQVCPTGAIVKISKEEKTAIQVGRAKVNHENCIVKIDNVPCSACKKSCPTGAISLVGDGKLKVPAVNEEKCTGCGACEYHCPARPFAAIQVEANLDHKKI